MHLKDRSILQLLVIGCFRLVIVLIVTLPAVI
jgi:hypothetical protein